MKKQYYIVKCVNAACFGVVTPQELKRVAYFSNKRKANQQLKALIKNNTCKRTYYWVDFE